MSATVLKVLSYAIVIYVSPLSFEGQVHLATKNDGACMAAKTHINISQKKDAVNSGSQKLPGISQQEMFFKAPGKVRTMDLIEELKKRDTFLTTKEVMRLLRLQRNTLCEWVRVGRISAVRTGAGYLFDPRLLAKWLTERTMITTPSQQVNVYATRGRATAKSRESSGPAKDGAR